MSMNWLKGLHDHMEEPGRQQAIPIFAGRRPLALLVPVMVAPTTVTPGTVTPELRIRHGTLSRSGRSLTGAGHTLPFLTGAAA